MKRRHLLSIASGLVAVAILSMGAFRPQQQNIRADSNDYRTAPVVRKPFAVNVSRIGTLKPVTEQRVFAQVDGVIQDMAAQGTVVKAGDVVLKVDPTPHEDARVLQESVIVISKAEHAKLKQESAKILNQAKEDVTGYELRLELEKLRLVELKRGPEESEILNTESALTNARALLDARIDELKVIDELAALGFASKEELRQKQLQVTEQKLQVEQAEIKNRKIRVIDPVKIAEQELKVKDAVKTRDAATERAGLLERNMQRDEERHVRRMEREAERLEMLAERVKKCMHIAPGPGLIVHKRSRWYGFAAGRQVAEGQEVMSLPDFSKMKVVLTVDEARIGWVAKGLAAQIRPAGWRGEPFKGIVTRVAEKGRDEFEYFEDETVDIIGRANRQVFDVEVEIESQSPVLRIGLRTDVELVIRTIENALVIPRTALSRAQDGSSFVRVGDGRERKTVKVLAENELSAAVEGLNESERVWIVETK